MLEVGEGAEETDDLLAAESLDGINWKRPSLGLYEFNGSKDNNIVWTGSGGHNFSPFKDTNPAALPGERYKAVGSGRVGGEPVLLGYVSQDGIQWRQLREEPLLTDGKFDSLNVAFWDLVRNHYVALYRDFRHGIRTIKYSKSKNFLDWTAGEWGDFGETPPEHLYTNGTVPYFRAPHLYLALPRRFLPWRQLYPDAPVPGASDGQPRWRPLGSQFPGIVHPARSRPKKLAPTDQHAGSRDRGHRRG